MKKQKFISKNVFCVEVNGICNICGTAIEDGVCGNRHIVGRPYSFAIQIHKVKNAISS